jgi:hypothetical protein
MQAACFWGESHFLGGRQKGAEEKAKWLLYVPPVNYAFPLFSCLSLIWSLSSPMSKASGA